MTEKCEDIKEIKQAEKSHVPWAVFILAVSILATAIGWVMTVSSSADQSAQEAKDSVAGIKTDVAVTKNDVSWIRQTLEKNPAQFKQGK